MTVAELIEKLSKLPQDSKVYMSDLVEEGEDWGIIPLTDIDEGEGLVVLS